MINIQPGAPRCVAPYTAPALTPAQQQTQARQNAENGMNGEVSSHWTENGKRGRFQGMNGGGKNWPQVTNGSTAWAQGTNGAAAMWPQGTNGGQWQQGMNGGGNQWPQGPNGAGMQTSGGMSMAVDPVNGGEDPNTRFDTEATEGLTSVVPEDFDDHMSADEAARHSWRALLARNVGRSVIANFLLGTQNTVSVEGELYEVGTDYLVIYQPAWDSHITADLYSVKFVEFREPPSR